MRRYIVAAVFVACSIAAVAADAKGHKNHKVYSPYNPWAQNVKAPRAQDNMWTASTYEKPHVQRYVDPLYDLDNCGIHRPFPSCAGIGGN